MDIEQPEAQPRAITALDRARAFSEALADSARRARFSSRSRRALSAGGFQARSGATAQRWLIVISGLLFVAIPSALAAVYFSFVASDQYVVELRFTVAGGEPPIADGLQLAAGLPSIAIVQDTQIVVNYITSRAAVEKLDAEVGLRSLFSDPKIDWYARFDRDAPIEQFVRYWQSMVSTSIKLPSGIVELQVRAFNPQDAVKLGDAILRTCEQLINDLNDRMNHDMLASAEFERDRVAERLAQARAALERARNEEGILDAEKTGEAIAALIAKVRETQLSLERDYNSQLRIVSPNAPQMQSRRDQINATKAQIEQLEAMLTKSAATSRSGKPIADSMTRFAELDLEKQIAERLYASAFASWEAARIGAEHKLMYLNAFVRPAPPEESRYPRRFLFWLAFTAVVSFLWLALVGLGVLIRNHMA